MTIKDIFRIIRKNWLLLLIFPAMVSYSIYYFTRNEPKVYSSSVLIYTGIASGYKITSEEHPRLDHNAVNNAFDNLLNTLKARETVEEVSLRLLAAHLMMPKPDNAQLTTESFRQLQQFFPRHLRKGLVDTSSFDVTYQNLVIYRHGKGEHHMNALLGSNSAYGVGAIQGAIKASRKENSDMLEVSYSCNDPGICQYTLQLLSEAFIRRYREIKEGEIRGIVEYFSKQADANYKRLKEAEENLKDFGIRNKIIDYDEEAKSISVSKQVILDEIRKEKLALASAEATVKNLESKIDSKKSLMETNEQIVSKRKELADLNYRIANGKIYNIGSEEMAKLKEEAEDVKIEIESVVNSLYEIDNSEEGLPRKSLISQWMNNKLAIDESTARLELLESKIKEYDRLYEKMAPLRPLLSSLEREVAVAEREYMNALNALNINKQRQQNIELTSSLKVVDRPYFPGQPNPSKRMVLVMGGFFAGFVFLLGGLTGRELLDTSIRTPTRAERITGLSIAGVIPYIPSGTRDGRLLELDSGLMEQAISSIILELTSRGKTEYPKKIVLTSANPGEGKSWVSRKLAQKLEDIYGKVLFVTYKSSGVMPLEEPGPLVKTLFYRPGKHFVNNASLDELVPESVNCRNYKYIILELPSLSEQQIPVDLIANMDLALLVLAADRGWKESDVYISRLYKKATMNQPLLLLNKVRVDRLEGLEGVVRRKGNYAKLYRRFLRRKKSAKV